MQLSVECAVEHDGRVETPDGHENGETWRALVQSESFLDVRETARLAGFDGPVYLCRRVFQDWVYWRREDDGCPVQDWLVLRLLKVLLAAREALARVGVASTDRCNEIAAAFSVQLVPREQAGVALAHVTLHAIQDVVGDSTGSVRIRYFSRH